MQIEISSPSKAFFKASPEEFERLHRQLSYTNTAAQHQVKRHFGNRWLRQRDEDAWNLKLTELKALVHNTLIFNDDTAPPIGPYIRPGSIPYLTNFELQIANNVKYPTPKKVPWLKPLPFELHPYQEESWQKLIEIIHGNVELCTGSGKSAILLKVCRETGFYTAVIAPSKSIFDELVEKFEYHFGKKMVGTFGDGKKVLGKRFTICIGDSVANIKPGTEEWEFFSNLQMMCVDESHTWGADSLEEICHGVLANVPYRSFFSGTQTRNDGTAKKLRSIIGKTVCVLTTKEAREKGYICDHDFKIVDLESSDPNNLTPDPLGMKRIHFLGNKNIAAFIAKLANIEATTGRRQTLVLVEELHQIVTLLPLLKVPTAIAHSEKNAKKLALIGLPKVDRAESVEKFNKGEVMVLIGTSCISTGTNIYPVHHCMNWQGGASEIKTKQGAVGRSVRHGAQNPWADRCTPKLKSTIWDFRVYDVPIMVDHLEDRVEHYNDSGSEIKYIKLKK